MRVERLGSMSILALVSVAATAQQSATPLDAPLVTLGIYDRYGTVIDFDNDGFMDAVSWW